MTTVAHAELLSVGSDEAVVTFTTEPGVEVVTRVGDHEVVTTGPFHTAVVAGLEPDTEYPLVVEGAPSDERWLPTTLRTLARPAGRLLATVATANDVHFGETECGRSGDPAIDAVGPILRVAPGDPPYPEVMNGAVVDEMLALAPDAVVVKGDLTDSGRAEEYAAFLACYGRLGARMHHVRGNHDAIRDPELARNGAPFTVAVPGATLAVLDTVVPGQVGGALDTAQLGWLDDVAATTSGPVLVFAHHPVFHWDRDYCIGPDADAVVGAARPAAQRGGVARRPHPHQPRGARPACAGGAPGRGELREGLPGRVGGVPRVRGWLHPGAAPRAARPTRAPGRSGRAPCSRATTATSCSARWTTAASPAPGDIGAHVVPRDRTAREQVTEVPARACTSCHTLGLR